MITQKKNTKTGGGKELGLHKKKNKPEEDVRGESWKKKLETGFRKRKKNKEGMLTARRAGPKAGAEKEQKSAHRDDGGGTVE